MVGRYSGLTSSPLSCSDSLWQVQNTCWLCTFSYNLKGLETHLGKMSQTNHSALFDPFHPIPTRGERRGHNSITGAINTHVSGAVSVLFVLQKVTGTSCLMLGVCCCSCWTLLLNSIPAFHMVFLCNNTCSGFYIFQLLKAFCVCYSYCSNFCPYFVTFQAQILT